MRGQSASDGGKRLFGAFHYVVAPSTMNVDIDKARNGDLAGCLDLMGTLGKLQIVTRANGFNHTIADEDTGIVNFSGRRKGARYMKECGGHGEKLS